MSGKACRDLKRRSSGGGGCYADVYHWRDGRRPGPPQAYLQPLRGCSAGASAARPERAWHRRVPRTVLRLGSGARILRERRNGGRMRPPLGRISEGEAGSREPRLWSIGNEQFGIWERGHTSPPRLRRALPGVSAGDEERRPGIETVANGADTYGMRWNVGLLDVAAGEIDYLPSTSTFPRTTSSGRSARRATRRASGMTCSRSTGRSSGKLAEIDGQIRQLAGRSIPIAWTSGTSGGLLPHDPPRACLRDALAAALHLMSFPGARRRREGREPLLAGQHPLPARPDRPGSLLAHFHLPCLSSVRRPCPGPLRPSRIEVRLFDPGPARDSPGLGDPLHRRSATCSPRRMSSRPSS